MARLIVVLSVLFAISGALLMTRGTALGAPGADGPNTVKIDLACRESDYTAVINLRADVWGALPGSDGGNFILTDFDEFDGVFIDAAGNEHPFAEPPTAKGDSFNALIMYVGERCQFTFTLPFDGGTLHVFAIVRGFFPCREPIVRGT
jgi:hypothetical protein